MSGFVGVHKEEYIINGQPCRVVANFMAEDIHIHTRGYSGSVPLGEYEDFEGNMKEFATFKINEAKS